MSSVETKALWVEVRDSETGKRFVAVYAAPTPKNRAERERFLNRYVPLIFPGAEPKRYAGGTGTFVAGMLLINAHYGAVSEEAELLPVDEPVNEAVAERPGQGELFAA